MDRPSKYVGSLEASSIVCIQAGESNISAIGSLILEHGPNDWNYLPEDQIREHLAGIATGSTLAVFAFSKPQQLTVGAVTYETSERYARYQPVGRETEVHGYVAEAVVHKDFKGRGIGPVMLRAAIQDLVSGGMQEIYAMRHADNNPSRRMMEKAGMVLVDEFEDPEIRPTGSRRTAVMRYTAEV